MRKKHRVLSSFCSGLILLSACLFPFAASASESYSYNVTVASGLHGTVEEQGKYQYSYGEEWNPNVYNVTVPKNSKYYFKGFHISGKEGIVGATKITQDTDFVATYGIKGKSVPYTVTYKDSDGNELHPSQTFYGNVGDKPVAAYYYVDGYEPQAYNLTKTLVESDSENVFPFVYGKIDNKHNKQSNDKSNQNQENDSSGSDSSGGEHVNGIGDDNGDKSNSRSAQQAANNERSRSRQNKNSNSRGSTGPLLESRTQSRDNQYRDSNDREDNNHAERDENIKEDNPNSDDKLNNSSNNTASVPGTNENQGDKNEPLDIEDLDPDDTPLTDSRNISREGKILKTVKYVAIMLLILLILILLVLFIRRMFLKK